MSRVFRDAEQGPLHNPEFTLLEWYRPGFDHHALMDELDALLDELLDAPAASRRLRYREAFVEHAGIDPFDADTAQLLAQSRGRGLTIADTGAAALDSLRIARVLGGFRGRPAGGIEAVLDAMEAVAAFAEAERETLLELDVNPLMVLSKGTGVVAADALIRLRV